LAPVLTHESKTEVAACVFDDFAGGQRLRENAFRADHPRWAEWQRFSEKLRALGLDESMGFGPSKDELLQILLQAGLQGGDFIPEIDSAATD